MNAGRRADSSFATMVIVALSAVAPLSIDMFLPSMPAMADDFETSTGTVSLAVTLFLFSFAASQLFYGPLSDRFGRRPALFAGLALFVAGGAMCLFAQSVEMLVAGRVLQGFGGGAGPAIARAIIVDVYEASHAVRVLAVVTVATALAPMLAPIAGGVLHEVFGWRSVFVVLVGLGVALTLGYALVLPETNRFRDGAALQPRTMVANYGRLFRSRVFVSYSLLMALLFSAQLIFISSSSFVLIDEIGLPPTVFGFVFGFVAVGIMAGASISRRLAGGWQPHEVVRRGTRVAAFASVLMLALALIGIDWAPLAAALIVVPMFVIAGCNGLSRPAATSAALAPFPAMAGLASAVMGFTQMALASLYNIAYAAIVDPTQVAMAAAIAIAGVAALAMLTAIGLPSEVVKQRVVET